MVYTACDHKLFSFQSKAVLLFYLFQFQMREEMTELFHLFFICKILRVGLGDHWTDPFYAADLFCRGMDHFFQIIVKFFTDHFRVGKTDIGDPQTVKQPGQSRMPCPFQTCHKIVKGFLPKTFHIYDLFPVLSDLKDISEIFDKAFQDKFLQSSLRQTIDIHSVPADKKGERFDLLRLTVRIHTVKRFYFICFDHSGFLSAYRTGIRDLQISAAGKILCDLRNDHIGFIDLDLIPNTKLQFFHNTDIMNAGPADSGPFQFYRLKDSHRIDQSGSGRTPFNFFQCGFPYFIFPFKGIRISWKLCSGPQGISISNVIIQGNKSV